MRIIEIEALENGAHRNQNVPFSEIPLGWARIPDNMTLPASFPFVSTTVEGNVVVSMESGIVPPPDPVVPNEIEQLRADVDYIAVMSGIDL